MKRVLPIPFRFHCFYIFLLAAGMLTSCSNKEKFEEILLLDKWMFNLTDSREFSAPDYDDSNWQKIETGRDWESQGFNNDGFAWYRFSVELPAELKKQDSARVLQFHLGKIDDNDQVYLNGELIGENNLSLPLSNPVSDDFTKGPDLYDQNRVYELAIDDSRIRWGKKNVLAVRVFDKRNGGGMSGGIPYIATSATYQNQIIKFGSTWKFNTQDSIMFSKTQYADQKWKKIPVPSVWEDQGYPDHDGFAWYRSNVTIPASWKAGQDLTVFLAFNLTKIDDNDQVFLNGKLLGENNKLLDEGAIPSDKFKDADPMYELERMYKVPLTDQRILWGKKNTLAIRVFDKKLGGGMAGPAPFVRLRPIGDYLDINCANFNKSDPTNKELTDSIVYFKNSHEDLTFKGEVYYVIEDIRQKKTLASHSENIIIRPKGEAILPISIPYTEEEVLLRIYLRSNGRNVKREIIKIPFSLKPEA